VKIERRTHGAVLIIQPEGPIVGEDAGALHASLMSALRAQAGRVVLDASAVPYIDSNGLEALVEAGERMAGAGRCLKMCGVNETIREVFELTEVAGLFEHYENAAAAARSFL